MIDEADDRQLMLRFQESGDAPAFATLFERHKDGLKTFLMRLAGNADVAEEVSQRTWLKVLEVAERGGYVEKAATFRTYLFTLARNNYIDEYRKHIAREERFDDEHTPQPQSANDPRRETGAAQMRNALNKAVSELPQEQREVIAFWASGMDMECIARIVGVSRDTAIGRKRYAMEKLRHAIMPIAAEVET